MKTIKVLICFGTHCTMMGAMDILESINEVKAEYDQAEIEVEETKCFGNCKTEEAPVVVVAGQKICSATTEKVMAKIMEVARQ